MSNRSKKHVDIQALVQDIIKAKKNEFIKKSLSINKSNPGIYLNMKTLEDDAPKYTPGGSDYDDNLSNEGTSRFKGKQEDLSDNNEGTSKTGKLEEIREGELEEIREGKLEEIREGKLEEIRDNQKELEDEMNNNPVKHRKIKRDEINDYPKKIKYKYVSFKEDDEVSEEQIKKELTLFCQNGTKTILDAIYEFDEAKLRSKMNKTSNIYVKEMSDNLPKHVPFNLNNRSETLKVEIEEILPTELDIYKDFRELMDEHSNILTESDSLSPFDFIRKYETYFCIDHNSFNVQLDLASIELFQSIKHVNECLNFPEEYADFLKAFSEEKCSPYKTKCTHPHHRLGITMAIIIYNMKLFTSRIAGKYIALRNNILTYYDNKTDLKTLENKYYTMENYFRKSLVTIKEKDREIKELMVVIKRVGEFETRFHSSTELIKELKVLLSAERLSILNYEKEMKRLEYSYNVSQSHLSETKEHIIKLNKEKKALKAKCGKLSNELSLIKDRNEEEAIELTANNKDKQKEKSKQESSNKETVMIFGDVVNNQEDLSGSQSDDTISSYCSADSTCEHGKNINSANDIIAKLMSELVDQKNNNKRQQKEIMELKENVNVISRSEKELQLVRIEYEKCESYIVEMNEKSMLDSNKIEVLENTIKNLRRERSKNATINNRHQKDIDDFNNVIICQNRDMAGMRNKIATDAENIKELNKQIELLNNNFANVYNPSNNSRSGPNHDLQNESIHDSSQNSEPNNSSNPNSRNDDMSKIILSNAHLFQQMMTQKINTILNNDSERSNIAHSINTDNIMRLDHIYQTSANNNLMLRSIHEILSTMTPPPQSSPQHFSQPSSQSSPQNSSQSSPQSSPQPSSQSSPQSSSQPSPQIGQPSSQSSPQSSSQIGQPSSQPSSQN